MRYPLIISVTLFVVLVASVSVPAVLGGGGGSSAAEITAQEKLAGNDGNVKIIQWRGRPARVAPGRWILQVGPVAGGSREERAQAAGEVLKAAMSNVSVEGARAMMTLERRNELVGKTRARKWLLKDGLYAIETAEDATYEELLIAFKSIPGFRFLEPDFLGQHFGYFPNDPNFPQAWNLHNTGQTGGTYDADIDAPEAWAITMGDPNVVVAIIDTGIEYDHNDLADNMWTNPGEVGGSAGVDDDDNNYIDDIYGWDFGGDDNDPMDTPNGAGGHGTMVAGLAAAVGNNAQGIIGVAPNVKLMALKECGDQSSYIRIGDAVEAIRYVVKMKKNHNVNVPVMNASWGLEHYSFALAEAIQDAGDEDILLAAAAGNYGIDIDDPNTEDRRVGYPALFDLDNVITVANVDGDNVIFDHSSYGNVTVDLAAPGGLSTSSFPTWSTYIGNTYHNMGGTSGSAPHVAGAAALISSYLPDAPYRVIRHLILSTVDRLDSLNGKVVTGGRLNVHKALLAASIRTWEQDQKITPEDPNYASAGDQFGYSVAISGNTAIVGVPFDDDDANDAGSAFIFDCNAGGVWSETARIAASDPNVGDNFGYSVAIDGSMVVIGAPYDDEGGVNAGAAYIFEPNAGGVWTQVAKLKDSYFETQPNACVGYSVAVSGGIVAAGAPYYDADGNSYSGVVLEYELDDDHEWDLFDRLMPNDLSAGDNFGYSISIDRNTMIIGAPFDDDDGGTACGSAYLFDYNGDTWSETQEVRPSDGALFDQFGASVSISGSTAVAGALGHDAGGTQDTGAAYLFEPNSAGVWTEVKKLTASDAGLHDSFGCSVSISNGTVAVGASYESPNSVLWAGSVYVCRYITGSDPNGSWEQNTKIYASDGDRSDHFGKSVAISGNNILVGAYYDGDNGTTSGSAYVFSPNDHAPIVADMEFKVLQSGTVSDQVPSYDLDGDALTFSVTDNVDHGTLDMNASDGSFTYDPNNAYTGTDSFTVKANDGTQDSHTATVTITIKPYAAVAGRYVFYDWSLWDDYDAEYINDNNAIATDKEALLPGQTADFDNYTSYSRGINGIMIDVNDLCDWAAVGSNDFVFETGNPNAPADPNQWSSINDPLYVSVREGTGVNGSYRIKLIWWVADAAKCEWVNVIVKATANTGLQNDDVFYWGNAIGEVGNDPNNAYVDQWDVNAIEDNYGNDPNNIENVYDINRDRVVTSSDKSYAENNQTDANTALKLITAPN